MQFGCRCRALVNTVMNPWTPCKAGTSLSSSGKALSAVPKSSTLQFRAGSYSNLDLDTHYRDKRFSWFSSVCPASRQIDCFLTNLHCRSSILRLTVARDPHAALLNPWYCLRNRTLLNPFLYEWIELRWKPALSGVSGSRTAHPAQPFREFGHP
jgi:hypothetical protein